MPRVTSKQLSITLPVDMANMLQAKVDMGEYASVSSAIQDALRLAQARDRAFENAIENWLRTEVLPAYDEFKAAPDKGLSLDQVRESITQARGERAKKRR